MLKKSENFKLLFKPEDSINIFQNIILPIAGIEILYIFVISSLNLIKIVESVERECA
jgi:hypothetical protein